MPLEIKDCDSGLGNIILGRGILTDYEYIKSLTEHLNQDQEKFSKYKFSLTDVTAVTKLDLSTESINIIANLCIEASKVNPDPIVAIAANRDLMYGLARMYEALVDRTDWETMVFRSKKEAVEWIRKRVIEKFGIVDITFE